MCRTCIMSRGNYTYYINHPSAFKNPCFEVYAFLSQSYMYCHTASRAQFSSKGVISLSHRNSRKHERRKKEAIQKCLPKFKLGNFIF